MSFAGSVVPAAQSDRRGVGRTARPADGLSHIEFLERLLRVEVDATAARRHASLLRFACFPALWRIEDFDYDAQPAVDRKLVEALLTLASSKTEAMCC